MKDRHRPPAEELTRIPGLYRRWELPEVLCGHRIYRIEKAGAHQDGTPLVAIYADAPDPAGHLPEPMRRGRTWE